jgi:hypothetical protein
VLVCPNDTKKVSRAIVERLTDAVCSTAKWLKSSSRNCLENSQKAYGLWLWVVHSIHTVSKNGLSTSCYPLAEPQFGGLSEFPVSLFRLRFYPIWRLTQ